MTRRIMLWAMLVATAAMLCGCGAWRTSKSLYKEYINPSPKVDTKLDLDESDPEVRLAAAMAPADEKLNKLLRAMYTQDYYPTDEWVARIRKDFPWISGLVMVSSDGEILQKYPDGEDLKPLNLKAVLALESKWSDRDVRTYIDQTPLGPEIYMAMPFFKLNAWQGLTVIHFDIRNLVQLSPYANDLIVFSPGFPLWAGGIGAAADPLVNDDWKTILKESVTGDRKYSTGNFHWASRTFGQNTLIYAVKFKE